MQYPAPDALPTSHRKSECSAWVPPHELVTAGFVMQGHISITLSFSFRRCLKLCVTDRKFIPVERDRVKPLFKPH